MKDRSNRGSKPKETGHDGDSQSGGVIKRSQSAEDLPETRRLNREQPDGQSSTSRGAASDGVRSQSAVHLRETRRRNFLWRKQTDDQAASQEIGNFVNEHESTIASNISRSSTDSWDSAVGQSHDSTGYEQESYGDANQTPSEMRLSETVPSSYEIECHPSMKHIPQKSLKALEEINELLLEQSDFFKEHQALHLESSKQEILETAQFALDQAPEGQPKKAVILGIGHALDIPLPELVKMYDHVTIVEMDDKTVRPVIEKLPPDLQKKVKVVIADVSGIIGKVSKKLQNIARGLLPTPRLLALLRVRCILKKASKEVTKSAPDLGNGYAFVCSQLLSSQLMTMLTAKELQTGNHTLNRLKYDKFGKLECKQEWQELAKSTQQAHIGYLAQLVSPQGIVQFADTYTSRDGIVIVHNEGASEQKTPYYKNTKMVCEDKVNEAIEAKFEQVKEASWTFQQSHVRKYEVISRRLKPKLEEYSPRSSVSRLQKLSWELLTLCACGKSQASQM